MIMSYYFYVLTHFRGQGRITEILQFGFWVQMKTLKKFLRLTDLYLLFTFSVSRNSPPSNASFGPLIFSSGILIQFSSKRIPWFKSANLTCDVSKVHLLLPLITMGTTNFCKSETNIMSLNIKNEQVSKIVFIFAKFRNSF